MSLSGTRSAGQCYGGFQAPDVVANLRVDQAWGSAQIMGALHQVNATYYGGTAILRAALSAAIPTTSWAGRSARASS